MKKIILFFFFLSLIISGNLKANPISPPPVISELYFNNNEWTLELVFNTMGYPQVSVSDSFFIITSTDTVAFKHGFIITQNTPILITKDSLAYPLLIKKNGDLVQIGERYHGMFFNLDAGWNPFTFGNIANAQVSAPLPGQSIKRFKCHDYGNGSDYYYIAKDSHPTLGTDAFNATASSSFSGHVYDSNHNPFPGVSLGPILLYCSPPYTTGLLTDANGYYSSIGYSYLYSFIRHITIQKQFCNSIDTTFSIEPDSACVIDFTLDSCTVGLNDISKSNNYSMQVFPNPGSENFTFQIIAPELNYTDGLIKIYNIAGEMVNLIPVNKHDSSASIAWNGKGRYSDLSSGLYTCSFEINGNPVAMQKLIIKK